MCPVSRGQCWAFDVKQAANLPLLLLPIDTSEVNLDQSIKSHLVAIPHSSHIHLHAAIAIVGSSYLLTKSVTRCT